MAVANLKVEEKVDCSEAAALSPMLAAVSADEAASDVPKESPAEIDWHQGLADC